ncbi:MAG: HTTM domain-containing protein [Myxococcales bacterium]|nr:HTTM domain-containing protein [Myxococcales bacterium]
MRGEAKAEASPGRWRRIVDAALLGEEDATALGLCRVAIVLVFTLSMLAHVGSVAEYFSDESMVFGPYARKASRSAWAPELYPSIFYYVTDPTWVRAIFTVGLLAHVTWLLGLYTRLSSLIAWLVWISMVGRNPLLYSMPDQWHGALAFYVMLLPTGRGFSLDARWRKKGRPAPVWCRRLLQLQLAVLYVGAGVSKTGATWRETGEALYYAAASPYNRHFLINGWLAYLQPWVLRPATFAALIWEVAFGPFVLLHWLREATGWRYIPPLRWLFLGFGVAMHLGIQLLLYVVWFSPLTVAAYTCFLRPDEARRAIDGVARRLPRRRAAS